MLPPHGKPAKAMPMTTPMVFGFEGDFDRHAYEALPEWLKSSISQSPGYRRYVSEGEDQGTTDERLKRSWVWTITTSSTMRSRFDPEWR